MPRILVVDDDPVIQLILKRTLQKQGYDVEVSADGLAGLEVAQALQPDVIICDWIMPGLDGLEVCRRVRANPDLSTAFFILLTARGNTADRVKGLDTGADDFLSKPIDLSELHARVRSGLRLRQLSQDLWQQKLMLEDELAEAAGYVRSLLPFPEQTDDLAIDYRFLPSRQLGGDCFDYYWLDPDYLMMYLLDVAGHGLGATLPSISILNLLRSQSLPSVNFYQPHTVLQGLNEMFQMADQHDKYFTIWYGVYNRVRQELTYSSAGHPPAVLITPTAAKPDVLRLKTVGLPIGVLESTRYLSSRQTIYPESALYIFSDGVYEVGDFQDDHWGLDRFVDLLAQTPGDASMDDILQAVRTVNQADTFSDDLSLLRLTFGP